MSLMIGAVVIVIIVAGAAFFMSGKSGAKNTAQSETQEKKGSEGKETAVVQEKAESADKSQSAEAREKKAKTESVLENDKEKGTGENTEKIISENQKVKNEEKVDFIPSDIGLSDMEVSLVNVMAHEKIMEQALEPFKDKYDYCLIDCMQQNTCRRAKSSDRPICQ